MARMIQKGGGIRSNNTTVVFDPRLNATTCTLYQTEIAVLDHATGAVVLNTGGHDTPTTFRRMNECLNAWGFQRRIGVADFRTSNTLTIKKGE